MIEQTGSRTPQAGELLILVDGRRFDMLEAETGMRGWWFKAKARDGRHFLQGNLRLDWDAQARAWRPSGIRAPSARRLVTRRRTPAPRQEMD